MTGNLTVNVQPLEVDAFIIAVPTLAAALQDADAVILLVKHTEMRLLTPEKLASMTPSRILIDTVNGWDGKDWSSAVFHLFRLGVGV
jgi:UDP-N-acetyl-D-mannosaminuronate dehydrogenase